MWILKINPIITGNNIHDNEPSKITIRPKQTMWDAKFEIMTKKP